jgi:hypothetical protein
VQTYPKNLTSSASIPTFRSNTCAHTSCTPVLSVGCLMHNAQHQHKRAPGSVKSATPWRVQPGRSAVCTSADTNMGHCDSHSQSHLMGNAKCSHRPSAPANSPSTRHDTRSMHQEFSTEFMLTRHTSCTNIDSNVDTNLQAQQRVQRSCGRALHSTQLRSSGVWQKPPRTKVKVCGNSRGT